MNVSRNLIKVVTLVLLSAPGTGCASMVHGSRQTIQLQSNPPGAQVTVDSDPVAYTTPTSINLKRGEDHTLVFRKEGFDDYTAELTHSTSGAVLGNVILGGVVGIATDYSSGAAYELGHANLSGDTLTVQMMPISRPAPPQSGNITEKSATLEAPSL